MYEKGQIVKVIVTGWTKYGIFVNLDGNYNGMIHISEIDTGFVADIGRYVSVKEEIYAKVISVDEKSRHVNLSIKCMNYRDSSEFGETIMGFRSLYDSLPDWIDNY